MSSDGWDEHCSPASAGRRRAGRAASRAPTRSAAGSTLLTNREGRWPRRGRGSRGDPPADRKPDWIAASSDSVKRSQVLRRPARIQPGDGGGVERLAGAEQMATAGSRRCRRRMFGRSARPPTGCARRPRESVRVQDQPRRVAVAELHAVQLGGALAGADPAVQAGDRRLQHVVVLGGEVDVVRQLLTHQHVRSAHTPPRAASSGAEPVSMRRHLNRVVVGMSGAGDLPDPQPFGVGLPGQVVARPHAAEQVGLGDDRDEWDAQIGTERDRLRGADASSVANMELPSSGAAGPNRECTRKPS